MGSLVNILEEVLPTSKESAVTQSYLSKVLGVSKRTVRQLVQQARHEGVSVCSTPYDGYWLSNNPEDIEETIAIMKAHIATANDTVDCMRKML